MESSKPQQQSDDVKQLLVKLLEEGTFSGLIVIGLHTENGVVVGQTLANSSMTREQILYGIKCAEYKYMGDFMKATQDVIHKD